MADPTTPEQYGIEASLAVIDALGGIFDGYREASADGQITIGDIPKVFAHAGDIITLVTKIPAVVREASDYSSDELQAIGTAFVAQVMRQL